MWIHNLCGCSAVDAAMYSLLIVCPEVLFSPYEDFLKYGDESQKADSIRGAEVSSIDGYEDQAFFGCIPGEMWCPGMPDDSPADLRDSQVWRELRCLQRLVILDTSVSQSTCLPDRQLQLSFFRITTSPLYFDRAEERKKLCVSVAHLAQRD